MHRSLVLAGAILISVPGGGAYAQTPQRTTATYDDWIVRCELSSDAKVCDMMQSTQLKGQAQPVTQIAIGRQAKNGPLKIVFQIPVNVWLPAGVKLATEDKQDDVAASYSRCTPAGCFAETDIKESVIKKLRGLTTNGKLQFKNASEQDVAVPVSFKGFGDAFDALQR
jgi:invasion protein IalB